MAKDTIGRYHILRKLGRGGMGSVYKAAVPVIDKVVAVKVLEPFEIMEDLLGYDRLKEIFIFEAHTMAGLHHSSIVNVWDYGEDEEGRPFFVMEFFCNNLGNMIAENFQVEKQSRRIHPDKVLSYGRQLLGGLSFLHHNDIIHRDMKPQNILITDEDAVKICDFGMALVQGISFSGPESMQIGSPHYAAPEQRRKPDEVDGRADLYSVGVLLYRMLTGELPSMRSFSLSMINPLFDRKWDDFFAKSLNWQPDQRFQTAGEMLMNLQNLHLHWQRIQKEQPQFDSAPGMIEGVKLRNEPENVCGNKAQKLFGLNDLFRPEDITINHFVNAGDGAVRDKTTGLVWKRAGSDYGLSWHDAVSYISELNDQRFADLDTWRLPTVNELFSLYDYRNRKGECRTSLLSSSEKWLWSSDRHGNRDAWYVNLDLCYADWQDVMCRNFVRAVSD
jgi:serine/threonine protein kinase